MTTTASHTGEPRADLLAAAPAAVFLERVSKAFRLPHQRYSTLKERALHPFASQSVDELHALEEVSFEVKQGEFFGIVGRNGSGKSTLLKCLAGIYAIDSGRVEVRGRLSPFIELGVGFNPDLTARDNVLINAIMLGLTRREARSRFDEIIAFAELEEFVDLKLKNYSSGMSVRLGFSVAIQVDADVLLVDEVLAVGDASFQQKCFEQFDRMKEEGRTILYVTHDMGSVERFCDRGMVLDHGRIVDIGEPTSITRTYSELNFGSPAAAAERGERGAPVRVASAWCETPDGERIVTARQGQECVACFDVNFAEAVESPVFSIIFRNDVRHTIFVATSDVAIGDTGRFEQGERATLRFAFRNRLAPSRYTLTPCVGARGKGLDHYARGDDLAAVIVQGRWLTGGVVDLDYDAELERG